MGTIRPCALSVLSQGLSRPLDPDHAKPSPPQDICICWPFNPKDSAPQLASNSTEGPVPYPSSLSANVTYTERVPGSQPSV